MNKETEEIKIPEIHKEEKSNKKFHNIISWSLIKESFKANKTSLGVVSLGNVLVIILLIVILSTLNINATKDSLTNLFSSASTESTVRMGSTGLYESYSEGIMAYEESAKDGAQSIIMLDKLNSNAYAFLYKDDGTLNSTNDGYIKAVNIAYDAAYSLATGSEIEKQTKAKEGTLTIANAIIDREFSEEEKPVVKSVVSSYLDIYGDNKINKQEYNFEVDLCKAFGKGVYNYALNDLKMGEVMANLVKSELESSLTDLKNTRKTTGDTEAEKDLRTDISKKYINQTAISFLDDSVKETGEKLVKQIINAYYLNDEAKAAFIDNIPYKDSKYNYQDEVLINGLVDASVDQIEELAYIQALPAFRVDYITDELGRPINFISTGKFDDKGNEIFDEVPVTEKKFDTTHYQEVKADMGVNSNLLQKQYKYQLTGSDYSQEEKNKAYKDSKAQINLITTQFKNFLFEYVDLKKDENGGNIYYNVNVDKNGVKTTSINQIELSYKVSNDILNLAEPTILDSYKVSSLDELNLKDHGINKDYVVSLVKNYSVSAISEFNRQYKDDLKQSEWSDKDKLLHSIVKSSTGVMDQLPTMVEENLKEMGAMNTYGIIIGVIFFSMAGLLMPIIYTVSTANSLVAEKVETGSMAFTLSTPIKRSCVVLSGATYLIGAETVIYIVLFLGSIIARGIGIALGSTDLIDSLTISNLFNFTFGSYLVMLAMSGICYMSSCIFNKTKNSMGLSNAVTIFFLVCTILGLFGGPAIPATIRIDAMNYFNYVSIISLFDANAVINGDLTTFYLKLIALIGITIVTYAIGCKFFTKKDLPL